MPKELHNIIKFYKKSDKFTIGYFKDNFDLVSDINYAKRFNDVTNLEIVIETLIGRVYKKDWDADSQSISKHTYGHLFEDWFKGVDKIDVGYKILNFEGEMRRLKINRIKKGDS